MKLKTSFIKLSAIAAVSAIASFSSPAFAALDEAAVEPYLKKQGCMKCHAIDKEKKGPSYKKVAAKYKGKADGEAKTIKNMTEGLKVKLEDGTEEEHKVIDTKDPADLKLISKWILSK
ncbi:MAG: cytochrome C [Burkholderiales bacterium RIFCSPLOWO2_02_FULL_57_36]|nr:MAG: cytochrome C [Burkholderiales bacterium RIFCSPLOWO2_02_FULL_57_36]